MMKERNLTCIVCPRGCNLTVKFNTDGGISEILGNACKRGITYAENECTHPKRTVTSTVRCNDGRIVAVKTADVVPKESVFEVMREINAARPEGDIRVGDVIIENVAGTGVSVVATANG
jgi:CxxC motif-containing protein